MLSEALKKNVLPVLALIVFVCITLPSAVNESSFFDAAWAWYLAKIINFDNWMQILANERHCILWYLVLKPFAVKDFFYPYSLQIINWLFCFAAIVVLWKKSSADNILKIIITFSFVVLQFFAVIARCYSIGFFGLLLLISMYKKSLKHPVIYSLVAGLTANTSAMASIPVSALTLIFIFDIFKNKKEVKVPSIIISFIILALFYSFVLIPFSGSVEWMQSYPRIGFYGVLKEIYHVLITSKILFWCFASSYALILSYILFIAKGGRTKFFIIYSSLLLLTLMSFVYTGTVTHKLFFTVYLILALLLQNEEYKYDKKALFVYLVAGVFLFIPQDIHSIKGMKVNRDLGFYMLEKNNIFNDSFVVIEESDIKFTLIPYILQNPSITLLDENDDFSLDYKMRFFTDEQKYIDYSKQHNKVMYFITHYPYKNYEPYMIFENKYNDDDGCERYIYKFD